MDGPRRLTRPHSDVGWFECGRHHDDGRQQHNASVTLPSVEERKRKQKYAPVHSAKYCSLSVGLGEPVQFLLPPLPSPRSGRRGEAVGRANRVRGAEEIRGGSPRNP
jgi:hypothetical protein